jgi:hypothetical protein
MICRSLVFSSTLYWSFFCQFYGDIMCTVHIVWTLEQNQVCFNKPRDDLSVTANPYLTGSSFNDLTRHVSFFIVVSNYIALLFADELVSQQNQHSSTVTSIWDGYSEGDSKDMDEPELNVEYAPHLPVRAKPLWNQERLLLRNQALNMKKRPVLSIGIFLLSVAVTVREQKKITLLFWAFDSCREEQCYHGSCKNSKTQFKKHPLTIQQLISELEVCYSNRE